MFLPPAMKLEQGNIFRSMCQEFCPRGVSRPTPRGGGGVVGLARGVSRLTPSGGLQTQTQGVGVGVSQHAMRQTLPPPPPAGGYYCGQYASYWNAFLLHLLHLSVILFMGGVETPMSRGSLSGGSLSLGVSVTVKWKSRQCTSYWNAFSGWPHSSQDKIPCVFPEFSLC